MMYLKFNIKLYFHTFYMYSPPLIKPLLIRYLCPNSRDNFLKKCFPIWKTPSKLYNDCRTHFNGQIFKFVYIILPIR